MITKRFIAGAVCPRCSTLDSIQTYTENGIKHRICVDCGFHDQEANIETREQHQAKRSAIPTRVNKPTSHDAKKKSESTVQVLKFYPNPKLKK